MILLIESKVINWRAEFHKALSNPVRLQIVDLLLDGEHCQCDIFPQIGLSQSTVSAYLSQLLKAGILNVRRDGTRKLYSISDNRLLKMVKQMHELAKDKTSA